VGSINVILRNGATVQVPTDAGLSIMEAIRDAGIDDVLALCGGCCSCATCHVFVDPAMEGMTPELSEDENDLLDSSSHRGPHSRLSCQLKCLPEFDGMTITVAPED
jgi:2Fe-2S ferredoxin